MLTQKKGTGQHPAVVLPLRVHPAHPPAATGRALLAAHHRAMRTTSPIPLLSQQLQDPLRLQYLLSSQRPLQGRLHLHLAELFDGEVEVLKGVLLLSRVVVQQQLGEL